MTMDSFICSSAYWKFKWKYSQNISSEYLIQPIYYEKKWDSVQPLL